MEKIRAAVVGYGNIGKYTIQALEAAPDFEIAGVVRRNGAADKPIELTPYEVVKDIKELKDVDVAILATPTRSCEDYAKQIVPLGINTVDSFDIHTQIRGYRERQMELNKQGLFTTTRIMHEGNSLTICPREGSFSGMPIQRAYSVEFLCVKRPTSVTVNDQTIANGAWIYDEATRTVTVFVPATPCQQEITVNILY